ncbi:MAG: winged helix-turn-helix transcriptional regulator [Pelosinus sp.]|nr:winged helix-turn-helix transcriptional regulator [Pelosinus sp.]
MYFKLVEYSVTERGKTLFPALHQLYLWGEEQLKLNQQNSD